jgi:glutathione peroxidase-family protein
LLCFYSIERFTALERKNTCPYCRSNEEIAEFCKKNYGVTFLMAEKVSVKGRTLGGADFA